MRSESHFYQVKLLLALTFAGRRPRLLSFSVELLLYSAPDTSRSQSTANEHTGLTNDKRNKRTSQTLVAASWEATTTAFTFRYLHEQQEEPRLRVGCHPFRAFRSELQTVTFTSFGLYFVKLPVTNPVNESRQPFGLLRGKRLTTPAGHC